MSLCAPIKSLIFFLSFYVMPLNNLLVSNVKRKLHRRDSSESSSGSPVEKRLKELLSDMPRDAIDDEFEGNEVFQALEMLETLAKKMEEISPKLNKLEVIEEKMRKLDSIEQKMENFSSKLGEMENSVRALRRGLNSSKVAQAELDKTVKDLKESVDFGHGRIDQVELKAFKHDSALKEAKEAPEKKYLYLEAYSRRENLKFAGIPESEGEGQEDTRCALEFLSNQLGFHHPEEIEFQCIHRIGKKGDRPRMIIARFLRYADRERVMKNAFKLKETDFKIFEDLPKELFSLRKKYLPAFYEVKKAGKKAVFSKSEPDKLFIDGKLIV